MATNIFFRVSHVYVYFYKEAYINHPVGVAFILSSEGNIDDVEVLMAAVLHGIKLCVNQDTIEDTDTTYEEVPTHKKNIDCRQLW